MKRLLLVSLLFASSTASAADLATGIQYQNAGDYKTAISNFQPLAEAGNPEAAFRLCGINYLGQGTPKNDAEAVRYCRIAAERGNVEAQYNLALFYQNGSGVTQDTTEATRWYTAAAASGHPDAKFNLDQINAKGTAIVATQAVQNLTAGAAPAAASIAAAKAVAEQSGVPPLQLMTAGSSAPVVEARAATMIHAAPPPPPVPVQVAAPAAIAAPATPPMPPPMPPAPPLPPVMQTSALAPAAAPAAPMMAAPVAPTPPVAPVAPAIVEQESSSPIDMNRYCVMAAQRGNPDPECEKEYSKYLPKQPPAPPVMPQPPAPVAAPAPLTQPAPIAEKAPAIKGKPAGFLDAPKNSDASATMNTSVPPEVSSTLVVNSAPAAPQPAAATATGTAVVPDAAAKEPPTKHQNLQWFIDQANAGNAQAQNNLGVMYRRGINGAVKDPKQAVKWFEASSSRGDVNGMMNLASMYKDGEGTKKNPELAYAWYNLASDRMTADNPAKATASENVATLSKALNNQQIGNALQYVTMLDEAIPVAE